MQPVRLGFLSTAHIHTEGFIQSIRDADDNREVALIWDENEDRGKRYAAMASCRYSSDLDSVLSESHVDGFVICAENTRHLDLLRRVMPVGKPVMCEKPLLTDIRGLDEVVALAERHGTYLTSGYFMPFTASMQGVKVFLESGEAGRPTRVRVVNAHHAAYGRWFDDPDLAWFTDKSLAGGGAFLDMGTHAFHLVRTLLGPGRVVAADIRNHSGQYPQVDDAGIAIVRTDSGAVATVEASWIRYGGFRGLEIQTDKGCIIPAADGFVFMPSGGEPVIIPDGVARPSRIDRLVAAIRGELSAEECEQDRAAIVEVVRWMEEAYRLGAPL